MHAHAGPAAAVVLGLLLGAATVAGLLRAREKGENVVLRTAAAPRQLHCSLFSPPSLTAILLLLCPCPFNMHHPSPPHQRLPSLSGPLMDLLGLLGNLILNPRQPIGIANTVSRCVMATCLVSSDCCGQGSASISSHAVQKSASGTAVFGGAGALLALLKCCAVGPSPLVP